MTNVERPALEGTVAVAGLPDATQTAIDGESHLGGLGIAEGVTPR